MPARTRPSRTQRALTSAETEEDLERVVFLALAGLIDAIADLARAGAEKLRS